MLPIEVNWDEIYGVDLKKEREEKKYDWYIFQHKSSGDFLYMTKEKYENVQVESFWSDMREELEREYDKYLVMKDSLQKDVQEFYDNVLLPMVPR